MSDFKTRLLGFSAIAMAFAGLSYGQVVIHDCADAHTSANPTVRIEGETELVGNPGLKCTADSLVTGTVYVSTSATITSTTASKAMDNSTLPSGSTDAVLEVTGGATPTYYPGVVSGTQITFSNVTIPAALFTAQVYNLRVNASAASNPQITATVLISYANGNQTANVTGPSENIAYALASLSAKIDQDGNNKNIYFGTGGASASFQTCQGTSLSSTPTFTLDIGELFAGAFKEKGQEGGNWTTQKSNLPSAVGAATQATQIQVAFANIPTAAKVYLPISVTSGNTILTLQGNVTADAAASAKANLTNTGVLGFTPGADGTVTATYVVTQNTGTGTTFKLAVFVIADANTAPVQTTAMTVAATYVPAAAITGPQATIPTFAVSTVSPINTLTVTACNTTLLFPYVTNKAGFETGIAISNTTTDNLKSGNKNSATATVGTCTLNFYGDTATQPKAFVTPSIGAFDASSGTAPVYANVLTTMAGGATEFSGYVIASCNFLDAHGYAFLVDGTLGQPNGVAQGYLALVTANSRGSAETGLNN